MSVEKNFAVPFPHCSNHRLFETRMPTNKQIWQMHFSQWIIIFSVLDIVSPSSATSSSSSTTPSSEMYMTSSSSLAPTQSTEVVSRTSAHVHDQNDRWENNKTTISGTASTTNFTQGNTLMIVVILWSYFLSRWYNRQKSCDRDKLLLA